MKKLNLLDANSPRTICPAELERKINKEIAGMRDERVIKPDSFLASIVMTDIAGFSLGDIPRLAQYNARLLPDTEILCDNERDGYDACFKPVTPTEEFLEHQCPVFLNQHRIGKSNEWRAVDELIKENGVLGSKSPKEVVYLKKKGLTDYTGCGSADVYLDADKPRVGTVTVLFDVYVPELLKWRTVFRDPEGLVQETEFMKTYLLFGGIPPQAINKARVKVNMQETTRESYDHIKDQHHNPEKHMAQWDELMRQLQ
jgi:hypothetical protein